MITAIRGSWIILTQTDVDKLKYALITFPLKYDNALLAACVNSSIKVIQLIQKTTVRVLTSPSIRVHYQVSVIQAI